MSISRVFYTLIGDNSAIFQNAEFHSDYVIFQARSDDPLKHELDQAKKRLGELMMENELLQLKASRAPAFRKGRFRK